MMSVNSSSAMIYGLDQPVRSICGLHHPCNMNDDTHRFLVGTCSRVKPNKINLIEYQPQTQSLECAAVWPHDAVVLGVASSPSPAHPSLFSAVSPDQMRIMQLGEHLDSEPTETLLVTKQGALESLWDLEGLQNSIDVVSQKELSTFSIDGDKLGTERVLCTLDTPKRISGRHEDDSFLHMAVDPHHVSIYLAISAHGFVYHIDSRMHSLVRVHNTSRIAGFGVTRYVDFSPTVANQIMTAGEDGLVAIHDLRKGAPAGVDVRDISLHFSHVIGAHEHHVNKALYNSFHGLVLTCSTDETMKLWDIREAHSPALLDSIRDCNDTVIDVCWGSNGPWVYAGLTSNGKVAVCEIPSDTRMSILLSDDS